MNIEKLQKAAIILFLITFPAIIYAWEPYDRVIAVVNTIPIIESEVNIKLDQLRKFKKIKKDKEDFEKSRIVDRFIENVLVEETADIQSIVVSNKKLINHIEKLLNQFFTGKITSKSELSKKSKKIANRLLDKINEIPLKKNNELEKLSSMFIQHIEKTQKTKFKRFINDIRIQMKKEQVMSIIIGISPPSKESAVEWYEKNKKKLGFEIRVKHILIKPKNRSLSEERKANKIISGLLRRVKKGESFEKLAARYSHDRVSAKKGGDIGWANIATLDRYFAGYINRMKRRGQISRVFKSGFGYHIVKYIGRQPVKFEKVERMIRYKLYNEKVAKQFNKWVGRRKKEASIKILMKNYKKG